MASSSSSAMELEHKKSRMAITLESEAIDRISNLPEPLLCHILSFLTSKEAAATSTLSTKWRPLWTSVPVIDLHEEVCFQVRERVLKRIPKSGIRFSTIVNGVFDQRTTHSLKKLLLSSVLKSCNSNHVMAWVSFAIAGNVEEIELTFSMDEGIELPITHFTCKENIELPITLFTCKTLVVLKLHGCIDIKNVPSSVHLPLLKIADINDVHFPYVQYGCPHFITTFLSGCPLLEQLSANLSPSGSVKISNPLLKKLCIFSGYNVHGVTKLEIDTPSLLFLDIRATSILDYSVENVGNLVEARLLVYEKNGPVDFVLNLIKAIREIRIMSLSYGHKGAFDKTCNLDLPEFCNLVRLELSHYYCYKSELLVKFLQKCPKLEVLIIKRDSFASEEMPWNEPTCVPNCLSSHLTMFKFKKYRGYLEDLALTTYIFKSAKLLKIATIQIDNFSEKSNIQKQISVVPRTSTICELVFEQMS
ncbi:FBD-associated F-box protein At4g10400-like [Gastrolobium bilobum]|uniref:FBD-associated F-box protein At4g10400-like n=1 Tax=Gastrolobium bilobum TaxID=150636 RepID=UPI002AAF9FDA|nr:FBD-associated F-box protein At4g10400-like [Gastrolobium bilobum]